jgi:hypothetical protein
MRTVAESTTGTATTATFANSRAHRTPRGMLLWTERGQLMRERRRVPLCRLALDERGQGFAELDVGHVIRRGVNGHLEVPAGGQRKSPPLGVMG